MISHILLEAISDYWPYFDATAVEKSLGPVSGVGEPEETSQRRGLWRSYVVAALSDPANLDLQWVPKELYVEHGRPDKDAKEMAKSSKKVIQRIYYEEFANAKYDPFYAQPSLGSREYP